MIILTKFTVFLLALSVLIIVREIARLVRCYIKIEKYEIDEKRRWIVWLSISYIIMTIICGI